MSKYSRRSFLKTAGVATGVAVIGTVPSVAEAAPEIVVEPSALPHEPLVAYVRDAGKGEVTVLSGLNETTFKDRLLVKRIQKAASRHRSPRGEVA